jgi:hypothetical protein
MANWNIWFGQEIWTIHFGKLDHPVWKTRASDFSRDKKTYTIDSRHSQAYIGHKQDMNKIINT